MRTEDYQFHRRFYSLVKWCEPNTKYILTEKAFATYNHISISKGYSSLGHNVRKFLWFQFTNNHIFGEYLLKGAPLRDITGPYTLTSVLIGLTRIALVTAFTDLILDVSNLEILSYENK